MVDESKMTCLTIKQEVSCCVVVVINLLLQMYNISGFNIRIINKRTNERMNEGRKDGNTLMTHSNTFYLRLYGIGQIEERGNPLPPLHRLLSD